LSWFRTGMLMNLILFMCPPWGCAHAATILRQVASVKTRWNFMRKRHDYILWYHSGRAQDPRLGPVLDRRAAPGLGGTRQTCFQLRSLPLALGNDPRCRPRSGLLQLPDDDRSNGAVEERCPTGRFVARTSPAPSCPEALADVRPGICRPHSVAPLNDSGAGPAELVGHCGQLKSPYLRER